MTGSAEQSKKCPTVIASNAKQSMTQQARKEWIACSGSLLAMMGKKLGVQRLTNKSHGDVVRRSRALRSIRAGVSAFRP
jgi:hypothetical protein